MDWWQILLIILMFVVLGLGVGYGLGYLIITRILKKPFVVFPVRARAVVRIASERPMSEQSSVSARVTDGRDTVSPQTGEQVITEAEESKKQVTAEVEEDQQAVSPEVFAELVREQERKRVQQQARVRAEREAEEARITREAQERIRMEAEQQAVVEAEQKAEEAVVAGEAEEEAGTAEQQARLRAETEAEEARVTAEAQEQLTEEPAPVATSLLAEIEANKEIAKEPWTGTLTPFQTDVWDASPSELHALPTNLREDLAQAYSDIQLANSIVWLARELKRRSPNLDENYSKLCTNITTRLEAIIPRLEQASK